MLHIVLSIREDFNMVLFLLSRQQRQKKMVSAQTVATIELNRFLNTHMQFSTGVSRKFVPYYLKSNFKKAFEIDFVIALEFLEIMI